jgi:hypothetical protein
MDDQDFAARLRRTTAEVPPSGLDLDDVLHVARGKERQARAVTGAVMALAVGLGGAGAWHLAPMLDGAPVPASGYMKAPATSTPDPCTDPANVSVTFGSVHDEPRVFSISRAVVETPGGPMVWEPVVPVDAGTAVPTVSAGSAPEAVTQAVLVAARADDSPLAAFPGEPVEPRAQAGVGWALQYPVATTYFAWDAGEVYDVSGAASCEGRAVPFVLSYTVNDKSGVLDCKVGHQPDDFALHVAVAWCPEDEAPATLRQQRRTWEHELGGPDGLHRKLEELGVLRDASGARSSAGS